MLYTNLSACRFMRRVEQLASIPQDVMNPGDLAIKFSSGYSMQHYEINDTMINMFSVSESNVYECNKHACNDI